MTQFIHLADAKRVASIRRGGIGARAIRGAGLHGFYCTPVSRNGFRTHQWLRELKRRGVKTYRAVQFYLPARTEVYVGRYSEPHLAVTAAESLRILDEHETGLGLEVIVPGALPATAIRRIYTPHPVSGWRFSPEAKGKPPFCRCAWCNRGEIKARRLISPDEG